METKRTRRTFSPEFKVAAARRVVDQKEKAADVAQSIGVSVVSLYQWVKDYERLTAAHPRVDAVSSASPAAAQPAAPAPRAEPVASPKQEAPLEQVKTKPQYQQAEPQAAYDTQANSPKPVATARTTEFAHRPKIQLRPRTTLQEPPKQTFTPSSSSSAVQNDYDSSFGEFVEPTFERIPVPNAPQFSQGFRNREQQSERPKKEFQPRAPKEPREPREKRQFNNDASQFNDTRAQFNNERSQRKNQQAAAPQQQETIADFEESQLAPAAEAPKRPVPSASQGRSWKVMHALDQRPNYKAESQALGYADEFAIPAQNLDEVWAILEQMQKNIDKRAFAQMVHDKGINVPYEVLEDPKGATVPGPNVPNKPWLRKPRQHQAAEEFFQTTPEYARSVYETYGGLTMRLDKNSEGTPVYEIKPSPMGGRDITIDFSKFDRFVDDFYGEFVRECKEVMMEQNPKEYPGLNAFIRIPDEPMWNPKLWAGLRTFNWKDSESLAQAWIRYAQSLRKRPQRFS